MEQKVVKRIMAWEIMVALIQVLHVSDMKTYGVGVVVQKPTKNGL